MLICTHEILNFNNFLSKHNASTKLTNSTANNWESNIICRTYLTYTEGEIIEVVYRGIFCVRKHGFISCWVTNGIHTHVCIAIAN